MIRHYGSDAAKEAAQRADYELARGDVAGGATWQRILTAIEKLQAKKPAPGETVQ